MPLNDFYLIVDYFTKAASLNHLDISFLEMIFPFLQRYILLVESQGSVCLNSLPNFDKTLSKDLSILLILDKRLMLLYRLILFFDFYVRFISYFRLGFW